MHDLLRIISRPVEQSEANEEEEGVFDSEEEEEGGSDADASSDEDAGEQQSVAESRGFALLNCAALAALRAE